MMYRFLTGRYDRCKGFRRPVRIPKISLVEQFLKIKGICTNLHIKVKHTYIIIPVYLEPQETGSRRVLNLVVLLLSIAMSSSG